MPRSPDSRTVSRAGSPDPTARPGAPVPVLARRRPGPGAGPGPALWSGGVLGLALVRYERSAVALGPGRAAVVGQLGRHRSVVGQVGGREGRAVAVADAEN